MLIKFNGQLYSVFSVSHRTPGNKRGFVQTKMRDVSRGAMIEHRFASEDVVDKVALDEQQMEYLYEDGGRYHFMNTETFEQIDIGKEDLGEQVSYLVPNSVVKVQFYEESPFNIALPAAIELTIAETAPAIKGATVTNVTKPATTETGLVVQVPPFIKAGEKIRVSTADGSYLSRS